MLLRILFALLPTVAYPFDTETLQRTDVQACAAKIQNLAGHGWIPYERAAFLILREDATFGCHVWPASFGWRSERWTGPIPQGTAAVIHTHPRHSPDPSRDDSLEAKRLDIPVIVVSGAGPSSMALPDGRIIAVSDSSRIAAAPAALITANEAYGDDPPHARQTGALPHQRP